MRKHMLLALVAALSLVVAVPAVAQSVSVAQCSTITRNGQAVTEYSGIVDGVEVSGSVVQPGGVVSVNCQQLILEAAAAQAGQTETQPSAPPVAAEAKSDGAKAKASKAEAEAKVSQAEAKAGKAEAKAETKAEETKAEETKAEEAKAELPKTGGGDSLFALGVGALLVGGGLLLRRLAR